MASNEIEILDSEATVGKLKKIAAGRALNRRHFMAALGMTGAAAGASLISGCSTSSVTPNNAATSVTQTDIFNFALNLEYLEATFYAYITQGTDLTGAAIVNSGPVTGAPSAKLVFTGTNAAQITDLLNEIYYDEKSHVTALISLLGSAAVTRPAINLGAAGAITATNALSIARLFEDVGVTAYAGAIAALSSSDITIASQILGVESFHSGALRLVSIQNPTIAAYVKADSLDVAPADIGVGVATTGPTAAGGFFATAGSTTGTAAVPGGFAFSRTTSQVLAIVYGTGGTLAASGATSGGFFPNGVNGIIKTV